MATDPVLVALANRVAAARSSAVGIKTTTVVGAPPACDALAALLDALATDVAAYQPPPPVITPPPPPLQFADLVIVGCDLGAANGPVSVGQTVRVQPKTTVKNQGAIAVKAGTTLGLLVGLNPPVDPVTGKFKSSLEWGVALAYSDDVLAADLKPGDSIVVTTTKGTDGGFITIPTAVAGDIVVVPNVDNSLSSLPNGRIQESDETNNMLAVHVTVQGSTTPPPPPPPGGGMTFDEAYFEYPGFGGTGAQEVLNREAQRRAALGRDPGKQGVLQMLDTTSPAAMQSNMTSGYITGARSWIPNTGGAAAVNTLGLRRMVFSIPTAFANGVNCAAVAQGAADSYYLAGFRALKANWLDKGIPVHNRYAWEGDGDWMKWAVEQNGGNVASCVAATLHVIALARQVDPRFVHGWCGTMRWWQAQAPKWDQLVPAEVSAQITEFIYDCYPRQLAGLDGGGFERCFAELDTWLAKPANQHLLVGLGEWSGGQIGGPGGGVKDWTRWTQYILDWLKKYAGLGRLSYQSSFNVFEGTEQADYRWTSNPNSSALYHAAHT